MSYYRNRYQDNGHAEIYTDGACLNNGREGACAGIGVWWGHGDRRNLSLPLAGYPTNNRAEIQAAVVGINQAADYDYSSVMVNTDSELLFKTATNWIYNWRNNGWRTYNGGPVRNVGDLKDLLRASNRIEVQWNKVPGHSQVEGNIGADRLARNACR